MAKKNSAYWRERFQQLEEARHKDVQSLLPDIDRMYKRAQAEMEKEIRSWYQRLADNNGVSMAEARKLLSKAELEEFKWTVEEYVKRGKENAIDQRWMKELENASARLHISRLEALKLQVQQSLEVVCGNQLDQLDDSMRKLYQEGYYRTAFELQKGFHIGFPIAAIDQNKLDKVIRKPWAPDGKNFSDRVWQNKTKLVNEAHTELTRMCVTGAAPDTAIRNIAKKMNASRYNAGRLVMTEVAYFGSVSQKDCFNDLNVERYEICATLDSRTSDICQEMDGKVFDMKDYEAGVTAPPFHVFCRTCTVPYFNDEFTAGEMRAARGEDGQTYYVPADMKYPEWKESFVDRSNEPGLRDASRSAIIYSDSWKGLNYQQSYTKQTAIDRLQNVYGIQFRDSKKYPMDDRILADCVGWLDSFNSEYSDFMENNPCKIPIIDNKAPSKMKGSVGYYRYYTNGSGVIELALNSQYHSDVKVFQDYVDNCVKSKWYPANATVLKTFIHEFGHHVSNSMRWLKNSPNWQHEFLQECIDDFKKIEPNYTWDTYAGMGDYVSRYGAKSESELFAEAFAEYFGGENPREFAKIFGKKLNALLKGVN